MIYVISYDISSDRVRTKLAKLLEGYGVRIQYSVFECKLTEKRFKKLYKEVFQLTEKESEGSVRFYFLCQSCEGKIITIGKPLNTLEIMKKDVIII
ncbi:MAG: CRISPR-associated endonuclease Cas2 [Eubacteriales bacterium]|nr:CRISPR-associated endonuclease Cas2 [Eubacteriales bacterium]